MQSYSTHTVNQEPSHHDVSTAGFLLLNEGIDDLVHNDLPSWKSILKLIKANDGKLLEIAPPNFSARLLGVAIIDCLMLHQSRSVLF